MATIDVKDAANATVVIEKPLAPGRAAAAASRPIALSTEDKAALDALATVPLPAGTNAIGSTKDDGPSWTTVIGVSGARFTSADQSGSDAAVTDAPTSGQKLVIDDVLISVDTAMRVDLKLETAGTVLASIYMPANSGPCQVTFRGKFKLATADKKLMVRASVAGNIAVTPSYHSEA